MHYTISRGTLSLPDPSQVERNPQSYILGMRRSAFECYYTCLFIPLDCPRFVYQLSGRWDFRHPALHSSTHAVMFGFLPVYDVQGHVTMDVIIHIRILNLEEPFVHVLPLPL